MQKRRIGWAARTVGLCTVGLLSWGCYANAPIVKKRDDTAGLGSLLWGRPLATVELDVIEFNSDRKPFAGPVEACIRPALRNRQWNVPKRPFRIDLGPRAALNFERLVKAAFGEVSVYFGDNCGQASNRPWIEAEIVSANRGRELDRESGLLTSAVKLATYYHGADGERLWTHISEQVVGSAQPLPLPPPEVGGGLILLIPPLGVPYSAFTYQVIDQHKIHAAREFGRALEKGFRETYAAVLDSDEIRASFSSKASAR